MRDLVVVCSVPVRPWPAMFDHGPCGVCGFRVERGHTVRRVDVDGRGPVLVHAEHVGWETV